MDRLVKLWQAQFTLDLNILPQPVKNIYFKINNNNNNQFQSDEK